MRTFEKVSSSGAGAFATKSMNWLGLLMNTLLGGAISGRGRLAYSILMLASVVTPLQVMSAFRNSFMKASLSFLMMAVRKVSITDSICCLPLAGSWALAWPGVDRQRPMARHTAATAGFIMSPKVETHEYR